jgi:hypothetical protein
MRNASKTIVGNLQGGEQLERPWRRCDNNIKIDFEGLGKG